MGTTRVQKRAAGARKQPRLLSTEVTSPSEVRNDIPRAPVLRCSRRSAVFNATKSCCAGECER
jgi:hypothetical protein